jgi:peptide/nickel transport system substrate-binding protein
LDRALTARSKNALRLSRRAWFAAMTAAAGARALGRIPYGGTLRMKVPWPIGALDPHALDDAAAALFAAAVADALYALDAQGRPYPTLARDMPVATARGTRVTLRPGLVTARGRTLDARDVEWSLERSAHRAGLALLAPFERPRRDPSDGLSVLVPRAEPAALATALASPVTALLPRGFSRLRPDGTGAFRAEPSLGHLRLERNPNAARGAAFLDRIEVAQASDLADALRSFESGDSDVGWLGSGLHQPRPGAVRFNAGVFGWVVLRTGHDAGDWGAPGVAQRLLDAIAPARLSYLGLSGLPEPSGDDGWGGAPCNLLVPSGSPHLLQIGQALAALFTRAGHEVRAHAEPAPSFAARRRDGRYALMLDFVRTLGPPGPDTLLAMLTAADPQQARRPPRLGTLSAREIARTLPLGVVGELSISGAHVPGVHGLGSWHLEEAWR